MSNPLLRPSHAPVTRASGSSLRPRPFVANGTGRSGANAASRPSGRAWRELFGPSSSVLRAAPAGLFSLMLCLHASAAPAPATAPALTSAQTEFFETKIRPVLARHCYKCHGADPAKVKGDLLLDTRSGLLAGGKSGPAIVGGDPENSLLIKAVRYTDPDLQMPPKGEKLPEADIANLVAWVKMGAPDPRTGAPTATTRKLTKATDHWAFRAITKPAVPQLDGTNTGGSSLPPVDAFIVAKLAEQRLQLSPAADRRTLIRRAYFDLIGLPPAPAEIQAFVDDPATNAFEKVVDGLLASPGYGERWGRHWLDVARYSDSKGEIRRQRDTPVYPFAWTYRDYVIQAFNEDKPFDQFIVEQIAADKLPASKENARLAALGFLTLGERFQNNENDIINDRIDVVTKGFLGLTVSCARCHDHMFDPIPTEDYYSLHGVFASSQEPRVRPILGPDPTRDPQYADYYAKRMAMEKELEQFLPKVRQSGNQQQRREMVRQRIETLNRIDALDLTHPGAPPRANVLVDSPAPRDSRVFLRGEADNKGPVTPRRFLACLSGPVRKPFTQGSGRLELAQSIASRSNPLTARVLVNRVWQHHFGEGIVATPDDFGAMGAPPTHPELLDYLAAEFMANGWSIKKLHKTMLLTRVYQQTSDNNSRFARTDPFNKLLWRQNIRRLEFEPMRDLLLAIGGKLDTNMFGPPVPLATSTGRGRRITTVLTPGQDPRDIGYSTRRTVYGYIDRADLPEVFNHFDFANPDLSTGRRHITTVPQQALYLMNSPLVIEQARNVVGRPDVTGCATDEERLRRLYEIIYQRLPRPEEIQLGLEFVKEAGTPEDAAPLAAAATPIRPGRGRVREQMQNRRVALIAARKAGVRDTTPLSAWAEYAHALLMANEAAFVN